MVRVPLRGANSVTAGQSSALGGGFGLLDATNAGSRSAGV